MIKAGCLRRVLKQGTRVGKWNAGRHVGDEVELGRLYQRPLLRQFRLEKRREHTIENEAENFLRATALALHCSLLARLSMPSEVHTALGPEISKLTQLSPTLTFRKRNTAHVKLSKKENQV